MKVIFHFEIIIWQCERAFLFSCTFDISNIFLLQICFCTSIFFGFESTILYLGICKPTSEIQFCTLKVFSCTLKV